MGAVGASLAIRKLRSDAISPAQLHRTLWEKIDYTIRVTLTGAAAEQVLAMYLSMQADDGFADGAWHSSDRELHFSFGDAAGLCSMSCAAALHWLEVIPRTDSFVRRVVTDAGWELDLELLKPVLEVQSPTLVELRGQYYYVSRRPVGTAVDDDDFYSDDGIPQLKLAELTVEERFDVECAAYSGRCTCEYCVNVLPFVLGPPFDYDDPREHVPAAWRALGGLPAEVNAAREALVAYTEAQWKAEPAGPPELNALRDTLAKQKLEVARARLIPMVLKR